MGSTATVQQAAASCIGHSCFRTSPVEISLLLSTYQKPWHLRLSLASIAMQQGVAGRMELIVTDDGSTDETPEIVEQFARTAPFPVRYTTHPHEAFQLARSRNEGVQASRAPYLLFIDGDCVLPPDHVWQHLKHREPGCVMAGNYCPLDPATSARFTEEAIRTKNYLAWVPPESVRRLYWSGWRASFHQLLRHPAKPKLIGNNIAIWRSDYERINGFDESFQGWGGEDDDLRLRLCRAGVRIKSILRWTHTYHLWHPPAASKPQALCDGANFRYLQRRCRLTRCMNGLVKRHPSELRFRVVGDSRPTEYLGALPPTADATELAEVEILFLPGHGRFSGRADCNLLVVREDCPAAATLARQAHLLVADCPYGGLPAECCFALQDFEQALRAIG